MTTYLERAEIDSVGYDVGNDLAKSGDLAVRWKKLTYRNGDLMSTGYHRTVLTPLTDIDATMDAVRVDLEKQGFICDKFDDDIALVKLLADRYMTPEVIAAAMDVALARKLAEANG